MADEDDAGARGDDADLRRAFAELRRQDAEEAPSFEDLRAAAGRGRRRAPLGALVLTASVLAALIVGVAVHRRGAPALPPPLPLGHWTAPTDFLLRTPGREVLETVPRIGAPPSLPLLEGPARSGPPPKRRSVSP